ncbi:uncharacterized protein BX663DRAFT_509905 [Cokeromyces recurvatus]|uniref:uncharacterized protein n=1 Tax=Cokeromyces recurvatus TaxID=90255 RepID=UPI00221F61CE|nr:uncharacterized protein BX663DRAFT_509905 [Cokeromyces recurvatus]KAI7902630.1 hypothetical protein BX663DRAFT_509905 [Cokeromyces recurvatus]
MADIYLDPEFKDLKLEQVALLNLENSKTREKYLTAATKTEASQQSNLNNPRDYQYEIFKKAIVENVIAVLDTGAGKTLISVMLIKHMLSIENEKQCENKDYKKKITFFIVDRVPLVFQQGGVIKANCDANIKELCGEMNVDSWDKEMWREIFENNDICILTAQIYLDVLRRSFLTLDEVNLMIFDECHHAVKGHPFNLIMYEFYHQWRLKPKIFSMTASPICSSSKKIFNSIIILETNLNCKVYTAINTPSLQLAANKPLESIVYYSMMPIRDASSSYRLYSKQKYIEYDMSQYYFPFRYKQRSQLTTLIMNKIEYIHGFNYLLNMSDYISDYLGPWCSDRLWKVLLYDCIRRNDFVIPTSANRYTSGCQFSKKDRDALEEAYSICLQQDQNIVCQPDINDACLFTPKAKALIECLRRIVSQQDHEGFFGIIFVERRYTAMSIKLLIEHFIEFKDSIQSDILIGHGSDSIKELGQKYTEQNRIIAKFKRGEINLLIATNIAEEGLDIQSCNYVIRFDMFTTLIAYIQSRGRARKMNSKYIMLVNQLDPKEINLFQRTTVAENQMKEFCLSLPANRNLALQFDLDEDLPKKIKEEMNKTYLADAYRVPSTGALLTISNAISLIYQYCDSLPSDIFCNLKPIYKFISLNQSQVECVLTLPINANFKTHYSCIDISRDEAKAKVSLEVCIALHLSGEIDDNLVPKSKTFKKRKIIEERNEDYEMMMVTTTTTDDRLLEKQNQEAFYEKRHPTFWFTDTGSDHNSEKFWISLIDFNTLQDLDGISVRPMCLITRKPLPFIPDIVLYNNNVQFKVSIKSQPQSFVFDSNEHIEILKNYLFLFVKSVTNKEFSCTEDIAYFLAPLYKNINQSSSLLQDNIDWKEIEKTINHDGRQYLSFTHLETNYDDAIVIDSNNRHHYFVKGIHTDMNPLSKICVNPNDSELNETQCSEDSYETYLEYYQNQPHSTMTTKTVISDMNQPLLCVERAKKSKLFSLVKKMNDDHKEEQLKKEESGTIWLAPEICQLYPVSASVYQASRIIPSVISQLDATLLFYDAKESLCLSNKINIELIFEAFTTTSSHASKDYQRLEFLGDSVLKFIASTKTFVQYPSSREDELSEIRTRMVSNKTLFKLAIQLKLYHYIHSQNIAYRMWRPFQFVSPTDSPEIVKTLHFHKLSEKTLADVIESTLGAAYVSSNNYDIQEVLYTARQLLIPLDPIVDWKDFLTTYTDRRKEYDIQSLYNPSLREVDIERVSHIIGYSFTDESLIVEALTHASIITSSVPCYQRLEFLGDAVLDLCVTRYLFKKYPAATPNKLHNLRKSCVNNEILSTLCIQLRLQHHIRHFSSRLITAIQNFEMTLTENIHGGSGEFWLHSNPPKVLSDVIESLIGAVYVDSGFDLKKVEELFERWLKPLLDQHISPETIQVHPLSQFKEYIQEYGCMKCEIKNITTPIIGPTLQKCVIFIHTISFASGAGFNTREARKQAAKRAYQRLLDHPNLLKSMCDCR